MGEQGKREKFPTGQGLKFLAELPERAGDSLIGRRLGDYKVTAFIAEGGMSRVYAATRSDGSFEREVAIKVSPVSGLNAEMRDRFLREQAVLATLNHPHITQLYDAHVTDEGWPYIVMEYIDGVPLSEHCRSRGLTTNECVQLVADVVEAVAYAHARLVIHRDIKPSNVLVDRQGGIKLLDFGIAKLMASDVTQTGLGPMTPRYASPELLLGGAITVTSDIYQLGLLLAEILLGNPLIEDDSLTAAIERAAGKIPVTLPPDRKRYLPKDLVQIIEYCLRPDPEERYKSASELRDDLAAYLGGFPVQAAGQHTGYRLRKFVARHTLATGVLVAAALAGAAAMTWHTWQLDTARQVAERNADRASQVATFLKDLLAASKPSNARGEDVTVRQVLDTGVERVRTELDEPELKASLLEIMGDVYTELGDLEQAERLLLESIDIHHQISDPLVMASALNEYGQLLRHQGRWQASIEVMQEALGYARREGSLEAQATFLNTMAVSSSKLNRFDDAEAYYRDALEIRVELYGAEHEVTSQTLSGLGFLLYKTGRTEESLPFMETALQIADRQLGPNHPLVATRALNLSSGYLRMGRFGDAEALIRRAIAVDTHIYGGDHHYIASGLLSLAAIYREQLEFEQAAEILERALPIEIAALGEHHVDTGQTRATLAYYYAMTGRFDEADGMLRTAQAVLEKAGLDEHHYVLQVLRGRGALQQAKGSFADALVEYETALAMAVRLYGPDHHRADLLAGAARAHASLSQFSSASPLYADAVRIMQAESPVARPGLLLVRGEYADVLGRSGQSQKALAIRTETAALVRAGNR